MRCTSARCVRLRTFIDVGLKTPEEWIQKSARLKKIARHLLATTCLTAAAAGSAGATTITEGTDFSNTFAGANALPIGTDVVNGSIWGAIVSDPDDYFRFSGLLAGSSFSLAAMTAYSFRTSRSMRESVPMPLT